MSNQRTRRLYCSCCGAVTYGRQWWNQDTGYGLCSDCIPLILRHETPDELARSYGKRGFNFDLPDSEFKEAELDSITRL